MAAVAIEAGSCVTPVSPSLRPFGPSCSVSAGMQSRGTPVFSFSYVEVPLSSTIPIFSFRVMSARTWSANWTGEKLRAAVAEVHGHEVAVGGLSGEPPP